MFKKLILLCVILTCYGAAQTAAPLFNQDTSGNAGNITATSNTTLTSLTNLSKVGTILTGTWNGSAIANNYLVNSTISGVSLGSVLNSLTFGTHLTAGGTSYNGSSAVTITSDATSSNTASTIVSRDASGNFSAGTITATGFNGSGATLTNIPNSSLVNSSLTVNNTTCTLGASCTISTSVLASSLTGYTGTSGDIVTSTGTLAGIQDSGTLLSSLATTSALTGYLPLSGGTLTGELYGTSISMSGSLTASAAQLGETLSGNSHIEIGNINGTASTPYFDFHSTGGSEDYDVRILASNGTSGTVGSGNLEIYAGSLILHNTSAWSLTDTGLTAATVVGTSSAGLLQATSTIGSGNVVLATSPTITTPIVSGAITQSGGENHFAYGTYTDPSNAYSYDAKFGGTNRGIAVNGFSIFNGDVNIGGTTDVGRFAAAGEIISTTLGADANFRMIEGNYGAFFRNDGANTYLLLTASGDPYGGFNSLRPFSMNNATGDISIGLNLNVGGVITSNSIVPAASDTPTYNLGSSDYYYKYLYVGSISASGNVAVTGTVTGASWTATSDRREKHNIQTVGSKSALDKVMALRAVTYNWNDPKQDTQKQTGWIAQEVEKAGLKSSVVTKPGELHHADGTTTKVDDFKSLKQNEMTAVLWAAVQEQQKEINQLKQQLKHRGKK